MLSDLLTPVDLRDGELPLIAVDPTTRFVYISTAQGPERVDSAFRKVHIPLRDWAALGVDEDEEILRVLVEASAASALKVPNPGHMNDLFWVRQRGWRGLIFNEALQGKFVIPDDLLVVTAADPDLLPIDRVILVSQGAGFLVRQNELRGVVSNKASSLMQIQLFSV